MVAALLITIAFLAWYNVHYKRKHPVETRDEYIKRIVQEDYARRMNATVEAAAAAAEARREAAEAKQRKEEEKRLAKQRKDQQARELAAYELEHRAVVRDLYDRQYAELMEERGNVNDKHRPAIDRKIAALEEKRFKNDLAIAKLYNKAVI